MIGFPQALSNVTWGTGFTSPTVKGPATGNTFDWDAARVAYLQALTLPAPTDREAALAQTFQTLGHVMHLVQDLAVPAHVRNDFRSHLEYCSLQLDFTRWCENSFERFVRLRGELVDNAQPLPIEFNGNRLTRFWDLDRYSGTNPSTDTIQGLAEYTNANFASQNTIFTEAAPAGDPHGFPFPREISTDLPELIAQRKAVRQVTAEDGVLDTGLYVKKIADGEVIDHFLKAGYLTDFAISNLFLRPSLRLTFQMDDMVLGDYAAKLLPRALGYSSGLLDYFFRGKLDVDVVEDMVDPSRLNLVGTNGSPEALVGGSLTVYADDPNGVRNLVASAPVTQVDPAAELPTVTIQVPEDTERFVAVYQGTLGQEVKNAVQNNPGAVIGKVLGGVRVEELFSDEVLWYLRTPQGVFPLPISAEQVFQLRWGDQANRLVGRSRFGSDEDEANIFSVDEANIFYVYEIARAAGSSDVPLVAGPDGTLVVDLRLVTQVPFPFGVDLGTTIDFTETFQYKQYVPSFALTTILTVQSCSILGCVYKPSGTIVTDGSIRLMAQDAHTFHQTFPLRLDLSSLRDFSLRDFALTATGHILALITVDASGQHEKFDFPAYTLHVFVSGGSPEPVPLPPVTVNPFIPFDGSALWALVDVTSGRLIATTAPPRIDITYASAIELVGSGYFYDEAVMFRKQRYVGGDRDGTEFFEAGGEGVSPVRGCAASSVQSLGSVSLQAGFPQIAVSQFKGEIAQVQYPTAVGDFPPIDEDRVYLCPASSQGLSAAFHVTTHDRSFSLGRIDEIKRMPSAAGTEQLGVLLAQSPAVGTTLEHLQYKARVATWRPVESLAELRHEFPIVGSHQLLSATSRVALVMSTRVEENPFRFLVLGSTLVPLQSSVPSAFFSEESLDSFVLLEPDFLYNTDDLKFYRKQPPLQRTALPATLAPLSSGFTPVRAYHALRLQ